MFLFLSETIGGGGRGSEKKERIWVNKIASKSFFLVILSFFLSLNLFLNFFFLHFSRSRRKKGKKEKKKNSRIFEIGDFFQRLHLI